MAETTDERDWYAWHSDYDTPGSALARRLVAVRERIREALCAPGGTVVWTRHRRPPDLVPRICHWFAEQGFEQRWLSEPGDGFGLGVHRFTGHPRPLRPGTRMFTFVDNGTP